LIGNLMKNGSKFQISIPLEGLFLVTILWEVSLFSPWSENLWKMGLKLGLVSPWNTLFYREYSFFTNNFIDYFHCFPLVLFVLKSYSNEARKN
jgi:hypothetical protein